MPGVSGPNQILPRMNCVLAARSRMNQHHPFRSVAELPADQAQGRAALVQHRRIKAWQLASTRNWLGASLSLLTQDLQLFWIT